MAEFKYGCKIAFKDRNDEKAVHQHSHKGIYRYAGETLVKDRTSGEWYKACVYFSTDKANETTYTREYNDFHDKFEPYKEAKTHKCWQCKYFCKGCYGDDDYCAWRCKTVHAGMEACEGFKNRK